MGKGGNSKLAFFLRRTFLPYGAMREMYSSLKKWPVLLPVKAEALKKGDIVLFPVQIAGADYCLHRIYRREGDSVQTMGDANRRPDGWISKGDIVGKAIVIQRGSTTIDCESPKWQRRFRWWNRFWRIRPTMLSLLRAIAKCKRMIQG